MAYSRTQQSDLFFAAQEEVSQENNLFLNRYQILNRQVTDFHQLLVSMGSDPDREILLFDPHSKCIKKLKQEFILLVKRQKNKDLLSLLKLVMQCTRDCLLIYKNGEDALTRFNRVKQRWLDKNAHNTNAFVFHKASKKNIPIIPMDYFLENRIGICRHHAFLAAFLLDVLIKSDYLEGTITHHRDKINGGYHAWVIFQAGVNLVYIIDTLLKTEPFDMIAARNQLHPIYGAQAYRRMEADYLEEESTEDTVVLEEISQKMSSMGHEMEQELANTDFSFRA